MSAQLWLTRRVYQTYPGNICNGNIEIRRYLRHSHGDGEEIKRVPGPAQETDSEHQPLVAGQL